LESRVRTLHVRLELGDSTKKKLLRRPHCISHPTKLSFHLSKVVVEDFIRVRNVSNPMIWNLQLSNVIVEGLTPGKNISHLMS